MEELRIQSIILQMTRRKHSSRAYPKSGVNHRPHSHNTVQRSHKPRRSCLRASVIPNASTEKLESGVWVQGVGSKAPVLGEKLRRWHLEDTFACDKDFAAGLPHDGTSCEVEAVTRTRRD